MNSIGQNPHKASFYLHISMVTFLRKWLVGGYHWNSEVKFANQSNITTDNWIFKMKGKIVLATSMLLGSAMTLLVPVSARFGYMALIFCRFLNGLAHVNQKNFKSSKFDVTTWIKKGMVWPAISDIFIRWVPVAEKSRLIGFSSAGNNLGNIIALPLGSYLCINGFDNGWGSIFYIYGFNKKEKSKKLQSFKQSLIF